MAERGGASVPDAEATLAAALTQARPRELPFTRPV